MSLLGDRTTGSIEVAMKGSKRLVFLFNEQYGNWELGFQKKKSTSGRRAVVVDLENENLDGSCSSANASASDASTRI